jgi:hypothetical protein
MMTSAWFANLDPLASMALLAGVIVVALGVGVLLSKFTDGKG